nr:MAG TPA: hypothetical protein [Caudoviricetes sp.]
MTPKHRTEEIKHGLLPNQGAKPEARFCRGLSRFPCWTIEGSDDSRKGILCYMG